MYEIRLDEHAHVCALEHNGQTILHLAIGTEFNQENAHKLADKLNQMLEALESVHGQFGAHAHHYGCECGGRNPPADACAQTRGKVLDAISHIGKISVI